MKICAVICEHNPLHNGHRYLLAQARKKSGCDAILCVMSGNFTQRGEIAICDKLTRAKHTLTGGADAVLELPTVFATANAETFARGAVAMLSQIPEVTHLAFGTEIGDREDLIRTATELLNEDEGRKESIRRFLDAGNSLARARVLALEACGQNVALLRAPNAILAVEYTKSIITLCPRVELLPIRRIGEGYSETERRKEYASASALRRHWEDRAFLLQNMPEAEIDECDPKIIERFESACLTALATTTRAELRTISDCAEGLEALLLNAEETDWNTLLQSCTSKRYSVARLRRILCANLLKIRAETVKNALSDVPYLRLLGIRAGSELLSALGKSGNLLTRHLDGRRLTGSRRDCYEIDLRAERVYAVLSGRERPREYFVKQ